MMQSYRKYKNRVHLSDEGARPEGVLCLRKFYRQLYSSKILLKSASNDSPNSQIS